MKRSDELDQLLRNLHLKRILEIYGESYPGSQSPLRSTSSGRLIPYTLRIGPGYLASLRSLVTSVIPSTIA
jgi:hypothetical protein